MFNLFSSKKSPGPDCVLWSSSSPARKVKNFAMNGNLDFYATVYCNFEMVLRVLVLDLKKYNFYDFCSAPSRDYDFFRFIVCFFMWIFGLSCSLAVSSLFLFFRMMLLPL